MSKKIMVSFRLSPQLVEAMRQMAKKEDRTVTSLVEYVMGIVTGLREPDTKIAKLKGRQHEGKFHNKSGD